MFVTSPLSLKGNTHGKRKRKLGYYFQDFKIQSTSDSNVWKLYFSITEMKALIHIFKWLRISFGSLHSIKLDSCEIRFALKLITMCDMIAHFALLFHKSVSHYLTFLLLKQTTSRFLHFYTPKYLQFYSSAVFFLKI